MNQQERNKNILHKYIPQPAVETISHWVFHFDFKLKIKRGRQSKYGDYRSPFNGLNHQITVNRDLNKFAFLITLVHEIAHLSNYIKHKNFVKPHGDEWKQEFRTLMHPFLQMEIFPADIKLALVSYLQNPAASTCTDMDLLRVLRKYDDKPGFVFLEELHQRSIFKTKSDKLFEKGNRIRKRYLCVDVTTKREYLFHPLAEVLPM